jgi:outer membrane receptor protein involved in Fe transport
MAGSAIVAVAMASPAQAQTRTFNVPAQAAAQGIPEFARQAGVQVLASGNVVTGRKTNAVIGSYSVEEGLRILLQGTGLAPGRSDGTGIIAIVRSEAPGESPAGADSASPRGEELSEEIRVTGTRIRGAKPVGTPVKTYTSEEIQRSGNATLPEFAREMPENFSGSDASTTFGTTGLGGADQNGGNVFYGAAFNLRGLGPGATLTLVNGHRIASAGQDGNFVDVSLLPLSVIDRVEVLPDGASAIYGADAVAGVVNVLLKKDYDGAETSVRVRATQHGGGEELTASQLAGKSWSSGNLFVSYEYGRNYGMKSNERNFIRLPTGSDIIPKEIRNSAFAAARQEVGSSIRLDATGYYSKRDTTFVNTLFNRTRINLGDAKLYGGTLGLTAALAGGWELNVSGLYSRLNQSNEQPQVELKGGIDNKSASLDATASGPLFELPGGSARAAISANFRSDKLHQFRILRGVRSPDVDLDRTVYSGAAEIALPLVGKENALPLIRRLVVSGAIRIDHYSDFGTATNPKLGAEWVPVDGISVLGTYNRSFRAPALTQLNPTPAFFVLDIPDLSAPDGVTTTLFDSSIGNPNLGPERSRAWTIGVEFKPPTVAGLTALVSYFDVNFRDRIAPPPIPNGDIFGIYSHLDVLGTFLDYPAQIANVQAIYAIGPVDDFTGRGVGPSDIEAIFDQRYHNIANSRLKGLDASARYAFPVGRGEATAGAAATLLFKNEFTVGPASSTVSILNKLGQPIKTRFRGNIGWADRSLALSFALNYWGAYKNPLFSPSQKIDSWATLDFHAGYGFGARSGPLSDLTLAFDVKNIADADPPEVSIPPSAGADIGFDPANANPLGRVFAVSVRKRW